ncbi:hypothetical protein LINPERHAP1_LOCUS12571 [Linum perenne]
MESTTISPVLSSFHPLTNSKSLRINGFKADANFSRRRCLEWEKGRRKASRIAAVETDLVSSAVNQQGVTWEIAAGAIAGVTPFVVAGIEFSKRIIAQRRCELCDGSGLVLMEDDDDDDKVKEYCRCPGCGGFLPWQSWKRFFTG